MASIFGVVLLTSYLTIIFVMVGAIGCLNLYSFADKRARLDIKAREAAAAKTESSKDANGNDDEDVDDLVEAEGDEEADQEAEGDEESDQEAEGDDEDDEEYEGDVEDGEENKEDDAEPFDDDEYVDTEGDFADKIADDDKSTSNSELAAEAADVESSGKDALITLAAAQETGQVNVDEKPADPTSPIESQPASLMSGVRSFDCNVHTYENAEEFGIFESPKPASNVPEEKRMRIILVNVQPANESMQSDLPVQDPTKSFVPLVSTITPPCSCSTSANSTSTMIITACPLHGAIKTTPMPLKKRGNISSFN